MDTRMLARFDPDTAICRIKDCQCPFSVVLRRKKQSLCTKRFKQRQPAQPQGVYRGTEQSNVSDTYRVTGFNTRVGQQNVSNVV